MKLAPTHSPNTVSPQPQCESSHHVLSLVIDVQEQRRKVCGSGARLDPWNVYDAREGWAGVAGLEQEDNSWVGLESGRVQVHNPARPESQES